MNNDSKMSLIHLLAHEYIIRFGRKRSYRKNLEHKKEFYISSNRWRHKPSGITAVMRVQNEESYLEAAIISALRLADEVICVDNGSVDRTLEIAKFVARNDKRVRVYEYPFICFESGPSHIKKPPNSVHSRSYFYNWCFSLARFSHAWKWDGDQVLSQAVGSIEKDYILNHDITHGCGIDLFSISPMTETKEPFTSNEPHFFRNDFGFHYFMGDPCEFLSYPRLCGFRKSKIGTLDSPYFYHLKYTDRKNIGKGWVENWREIEYFRNLVFERKSKGKLLMERVPSEFGLIKLPT
jgi:glycosyltransferase involved in cell wall biosynthesis